MKKSLLTLLTLFLAASSVFAQVPGEKLAPQKAKDQFKADYPDAKLKRWQKKGFDWVAHMEHENKTAWARYTKDGKLRWTGHSWKGSEVPSKITETILKDYPDFKVDWATETENPNTKTHHFWVHLSKPGFVLKVLMNEDGTYAKTDNADIQEEEKKDEE